MIGSLTRTRPSAVRAIRSPGNTKYQGHNLHEGGFAKDKGRLVMSWKWVGEVGESRDRKEGRNKKRDHKYY